MGIVGLAVLSHFALGPFVGTPTAILIVVAGATAGVTKSMIVKAALLIFSAGYFGGGAAKVMDKIEIVAQRDAEMAEAKADKVKAVKIADEGEARYRRWRTERAQQAYDARVAKIAAKYAGKVEGVSSNVAVEMLKVGAVSAKELGTALLVELPAMAWGSVLLIMLGYKPAPKAEVEAPAEAKRRKRSEAAKKGWETRRRRQAEREASNVLPMSMVKSRVA